LAEVSEVAENIYLIDAEAAFLPKLTSVYLINEDTKALVESASPAAKNTVLEGLRQIGIAPQDISYIIATHIHLDHAGGVGALIQEMPEAKVLLHPRGSKHLMEPNRLINSTREIQGEVTLERYGSMIPIKPERIQPVEDNQVITLGPNQKLRIIHTPGHAPHHLCIYEERNMGIFTGDAAGFYLQEVGMLSLNTVPPNFDLELSLQSLQKLKSLSPEILYFSHFGITREAADSLRGYCSKLEMWAQTIDKTFGAYSDLDEALEKLQDLIRMETEPIKRVNPAFYDLVFYNHVLLCIEGYIEYFKTKQAANR